MYRLPRIKNCRPPRLLLRAFLASLAILFCAGVAAQERPFARYEVDNAPADVRDALNKVLDAQRRTDLPELAADRADEERRLRRLQEETVAALATEGYFSPQLTSAEDASAAARYLVRVALGTRARVTQVDLTLRGGIEAQPARIAELAAEWRLPVGRPFRNADWTTAKSRLLGRVLERDFAAARISDSSADVDADAATVRLVVEIDSGPAFTIGALQVSGLERYNVELVDRFNPFKPGDRYDAAMLRDFQQRLQQSPYFGTAVVTVEPDVARTENVPVVVELREQRTKRVAIGAGYSTDTGAKLEATYRQAMIFGYPYTLQSGFGIDKTRFVTYADILLPPKPSGALDSLGVLYERSDIDELLTHRSAAGATRAYVRESDGVTYDTKMTLNLQREQRQFEDVPGQPEETNTTLSVTYRWTRREVDEVTDPRRGSILTLQGTVGVGQQLLDSPGNNSFVGAYGRYVRYMAFPGLDPKRTQLIARGELGRVFTDNPSVVPTDFLYRTGGAGTIRGYSYLSIGREPGTTNAGGTVLLIGSLEAVRWFTESWGGAVFCDVGDAALNTDSIDFGRGTGFGARFKTPAGPLALDFAYGKRRDDGLGGEWRFHFSVAIAF